MNASIARFGIVAGLVLLLAATRLNHFTVVPDASWAVFFAAGFYLRNQVRWAFPVLMALAVVVDYVVIKASGLDFWSHYCVSPGYWMLVPAYFSLWAGGAWFSRQRTAGLRRALQLAAGVVASVVVCHAWAQGGFYWFSNVVAQPTVAGWAANYGHWLLPYLQTTVLYVAAIAVTDLAFRAVAGTSHPEAASP